MKMPRTATECGHRVPRGPGRTPKLCDRCKPGATSKPRRVETGFTSIDSPPPLGSAAASIKAEIATLTDRRDRLERALQLLEG